MKFKDIKINEKFSVFDVEFIKLFDNNTINRPLSNRHYNAINLYNKHRIVFGDDVEVKLIEQE